LGKGISLIDLTEIGQMSAQEIWSTGTTWPSSRGAILRHPNGSIDIGAYAAIAHRKRAAAIASSMLSAVRFMRDAGSAIAVRRIHRQRAAGRPCV
jgi:hypothetical protein